VKRRSQQTIARTAEVAGIGFLWGADVRLRFLPAEPDYGIRFQRSDLTGSLPIPALVEYTVPRSRRTVIEHGGASVEMIEHVMAALAGLQVDNCLVQVDGPEPPGCDGSSSYFAEAIAVAGIAPQGRPREVLCVQQKVQAVNDRDGSQVFAAPTTGEGLVLTYELDYGPNSPITPQQITFEITPELFLNELAFARTFVLEAEAEALKAQGYGERLTTDDLLIFSPTGPIDNELRAADECARHKMLDCIGDLALIGCDICGHVTAQRSGHLLNAEIVRQLQATHTVQIPQSPQSYRGRSAA